MITQLTSSELPATLPCRSGNSTLIDNRFETSIAVIRPILKRIICLCLCESEASSGLSPRAYSSSHGSRLPVRPVTSELIATPNASASEDRSFYVHSRSQHKSQIAALLHQDLNGNALHHFDEITCCVLRREQRLSRSGGAGNRVHDAVEVAAICVHVNSRALPRSHVVHLCFFEVRRNVDLVERNQREQQVSWYDILSQMYGQLGDLAGDRRLDRGVSKIQLCLFPHRLGTFDGRLRRLVRRYSDGDLLLA